VWGKGGHAGVERGVAKGTYGDGGPAFDWSSRGSLPSAFVRKRKATGAVKDLA